jgi:hypothetical protein
LPLAGFAICLHKLRLSSCIFLSKQLLQHLSLGVGGW